MDPDERDYDEAPRKKRYRCGGWASYYGPCGAYDCEDCYPGGSDEPEDAPEDVSEEEEEEEMEKLGVQTDKEKVKTAEGGAKSCPRCGLTLIPNTNVPQCPQCGTEPFEKSNG